MKIGFRLCFLVFCCRNSRFTIPIFLFEVSRHGKHANHSNYIYTARNICQTVRVLFISLFVAISSLLSICDCVCSPLGSALAESLELFSLDLVGLIASFLVCGAATPNAKAVLLFQMVEHKDTLDREHSDHCVYGIAFNPNTNAIWAAYRQKIQAFTYDGQFLFSVAPDGWNAMRSIAFDTDNEAYVVHSMGVGVCNASDGSVNREFGSYGKGLMVLHLPFSIAADGKGLLFVAEYGRDRVHVVDRNGVFVRTFGEQGGADGQFRDLTCLAYTHTNEIVVADKNNLRIQVGVVRYVRSHFR